MKADFLAKVTWFTPNETEASFFVGSQHNNAESTRPESISQQLKDQALQRVILKLVSRGACISGADGESHSIPSFPVRDVDSTAAGDAFNGTFATGLMFGKSPLESAIRLCFRCRFDHARRGSTVHAEQKRS